MLKKHFYFQRTLPFVRFLSRDQKKTPVYQGNLTNSKDLNNQTLWDNRPIYVGVFKQFSLIHPCFHHWKYLQNDVFFTFLSYMEYIHVYQYKTLPMSSIQCKINKQILFLVRFFIYFKYRSFKKKKNQCVPVSFKKLYVIKTKHFHRW